MNQQVICLKKNQTKNLVYSLSFAIIQSVFPWVLNVFLGSKRQENVKGFFVIQLYLQVT